MFEFLAAKGVVELGGLFFGGFARLTQHWFQMRDKQKERDHEYRLIEKEIQLQKLTHDQEKELKQIDFMHEESKFDVDLLLKGLQDQLGQVEAAGGFAAKLSASVRPISTYWILSLYTIAKCLTFFLTLKTTSDLSTLVPIIYTAFDGSLLGSIFSFWFVDRSLRKGKLF